MRYAFSPVAGRTGLAAAAFVLLAVCSSGISGISAADASEHVDAATRASVEKSYGNLPLSFEANKGQADDSVKFLARGDGYVLFLTPAEAVLALRAMPQAEKSGSPANDVIRLKPVGANANPQMTGLDKLPGASNYFIGGDPAKSRTDVSQYAKVRIEQVYPGIDMIYYGNRRQLEYDWIVAPGADPGAIRFSVEGKAGLRLNAQGDILLDESGCLRLKKPLVYQESGGTRTEVAGRYVFAGNRQIGFQLDNYDASLPLVIDPVLSYSVRLGGSSIEYGNGIAVDSFGNAYVTGRTSSVEFPAINPFQPARGGYYDVFVTKLNPSGSTLIYSTYIGGSDSDYGIGIAIDSAGSAYVTGYTNSANFPTANPFQAAKNSGFDAFVTKLNPSGNALVYSTYLGGNSNDYSYAVALDSSGNAYVTGATESTNFPTVNPLQASNRGGSDVFVTKLNASGNGALYSTYLGGNSADRGNGIAVDSSGNACVTGYTSSGNFPTANAYQANNSGGYDAFVAKLNASGNGALYSTYLGGNEWDYGEGITVDSSGNAYVIGYTQSVNFPTANAYQATNGGDYDVFVTKMNTSGSAPDYSTYLGGSGPDYGYGIVLDASGNAYLTGYTDSPDFPLANAYQASIGGSSDVFVTKLSISENALGYSTYLGGSDLDYAYGIALDPSRNAYVTGLTDSVNFPTANAYQSSIANAFIIRMGLPITSGINLGDIDGDGKADFTVWRPGGGLWFSLDSGSPGEYQITQWGQDADIPVAGDYDGDGRMDLAVWRPGNGTWYILPSSAPGTYMSTYWGTAADAPVPADYDGDGKLDIAVWRENEGAFYVLPSNSPGTYTVTQWGMSGDVPALGRIQQ